MSRSDLEPFDGLNVITTELDEIEVAHLLRKNASLSLMCQDCGGRRFTVQGFIPIEAEILAADHIVVSHIDYQKIVVNRVMKCSHCAGTEFVTITSMEETNGQKQSSAG